MGQLKSQYEIIMEQLTNEGKVRVFTEEENLQIAQELAIPEDEIREYRRKSIASALELKNIFLD